MTVCFSSWFFFSSIISYNLGLLAEKIRFGKVNELVAVPVQDGFHHPKAKSMRLFKCDFWW